MNVLQEMPSPVARVMTGLALMPMSGGELQLTLIPIRHLIERLRRVSI